MFNFLFDGKLGEILAPVAGTVNQYHLAIQHHKNVEVQNITLSMTNIALDQLSESGIAPLHVACRYNNTFAVELLLSRGARVDVRDSQGNTALHYAAKYCHLELCKFLVAQRVSVATKNSSNQTAYDVTDNHVIRQYLLPLQFQDEHSQHTDAGYSGSTMAQYNLPQQQPVGGYPPAPSPLRQSPATARRVPSTQPSPSSTQQPLPPSFPAAVPPASSNLFGVRPPEPLQMPSAPVAAPVPAPANPPSLTVAAPPLVSPPHVAAAGLGFHQAPLVPATANESEAAFSAPPPAPVTGAPMPAPAPYVPTPYMPPMQPVQSSIGTTRIIQPDGFHSSASDPVLQQKYGHVKDQINIAPPPTAPVPGAYPVYSMYSGSGSAPGYNPAMQSVHSRYVGYDAVNNAPVTYQPAPVAYMGPPQPVAAPAYPPQAGAPVGAPTMPTAPPAAPYAAPPGPPLAQPAAGAVPPPPAVNIFDPATDVVSLNPNSRALL